MTRRIVFFACALVAMAGTTGAVERKILEKKPMSGAEANEEAVRRSKIPKGETPEGADARRERELQYGYGGGYGYEAPHEKEYMEKDHYDYGKKYVKYTPPPPVYYPSKAGMKKGYGYDGYGYGDYYDKGYGYKYPYYGSKAGMKKGYDYGYGYGDYYEGYYPMEGMYGYYEEEGDDFLEHYGGPCVHVIENIHFEMPPNTDVFEPNGSVFGEVGTMHVWALTTVSGYGTLDGKCIRTWPDFDGQGGDAVCEFVLTDPDTGDQLTFGGKLDSILPGGKMAVTGGSGSVSGVFGDMIVHAVLDGGKDVLDKAKYYEVEGKLGIIHCPVHHASR